MHSAKMSLQTSTSGFSGDYQNPPPQSSIIHTLTAVYMVSTLYSELMKAEPG